MKLKSTITINHPKERVWAFLKDPANLAKWDGNIDRIIPTSTNPVGVGYTFDTICSAQPGQRKGAKMSYRIIELEPLHNAKILLLHSRFFKRAVWTLSVEATGEGTTVGCAVNLSFKLKYLYLAPVLLFSKRGKQLTNLEKFEEALESMSLGQTKEQEEE
jgi:uncharacterized protein YndB with AHSA1/START domain